MDPETQRLFEGLVAYADRFAQGVRRMGRLEDGVACHLFLWTQKPLDRPIRCFDEARGFWEGLLGGRRRFCYDEWEGLRLAVTEVYRFGSLRLLVLTAFKKGARVAWPPGKR